MVFRPLDRLMSSISSASSSLVSAISTTPSQTSSAASRLVDVPMINCTPSAYKKKRARISLIIVLPCCLAINTRTVRKRKYHPVSKSPMISRAWMNNHSCAGSNLTSRTSIANSITANPNDVLGVNSRNGGVNIRGSVEPLRTFYHLNVLILPPEVFQR